ncbi:MAG: type II toxin-antitoxin system RelE/ParE family toxin [Aestuariivirga sp.]|nr:type II toxin-antitoxin system RelE/ParE family toxin [Aestuariivirga sp.]
MAWECMILGYRDKRSEAFSSGAFVRDFQGFAAQASKRLEILEAATSLEDLRALPSNRLEVLRGKRAGQFSVRINQQWRICFKWPQGTNGPSDVEIVDYH